jgi:transposase
MTVVHVQAQPAQLPGQPGQLPGLVVGVDTHQQTHHAVALDPWGRRLADRQVQASAAGSADLVGWLHQIAQEAGLAGVSTIGVESTGSYGAGLATALLAAGLEVIEVNRPDKTTRAMRGKSDPIDAESAARQVLAGTATARPKVKTGIVEAIRNIKIPRDSAVADRTAAYNQLRDLITTAPDPLRESLIALSGKQRVAKALTLRPDPARLHEPLQAAKHGLRALARRIRALDAEIAEADRDLTRLVRQSTPRLLAMPQVGVQTCARLAITAGENIDRMTSEARFAKLTGTAPIPVASGKTNRVRLNRGGDRQANSALYLVVLGRLQRDPTTRAYLERRVAEGKTKREAIRCLKRYLARSVYRALREDLLST